MTDWLLVEWFTPALEAGGHREKLCNLMLKMQFGGATIYVW